MSGESPPEVSVVLATSGRSQTLGEQLDALARQLDAPTFEVVVVANCAPAGFAVPTDDERFRMVRADDHPGIGYARNEGVRHSHGVLLLFVDDDDVVDDHYVAAMASALGAAPAAGARIELGRLNPGWRAEVRGVAQVVGLGELEGAPVSYGAALGVRRSVFDEVGPFDERLDGIAAEDMEWCRRLAAVGHRLVYASDALLHYRLRTRYRELWEQGRRYGLGGQLVSPAWPGWPGWFRSLMGPLRLLLLGPGPGGRRRGAFLLARRIGLAQGRRRRLAQTQNCAG